jgi:hypothetical protein
MNELFNWANQLQSNRTEILDSLDKTTYNDVVALRNLAAEHGYEMTNQEVIEILDFMREALD